MEGLRYRKNEFQLDPGDTLYVHYAYAPGTREATVQVELIQEPRTVVITFLGNILGQYDHQSAMFRPSPDRHGRLGHRVQKGRYPVE